MGPRQGESGSMGTEGGTSGRGGVPEEKQRMEDWGKHKWGERGGQNAQSCVDKNNKLASGGNKEQTRETEAESQLWEELCFVYWSWQRLDLRCAQP